MNLTHTFEPDIGPPSLKSNNLQYLIGFLMIAVPLAVMIVYFHAPLYVEALPVIIVLYTMFTDQSPVWVTISDYDHTFSYRTMNWLGNEKDTVVNLDTATINYEYAWQYKGPYAWRLTLYNNYFGNKISLVEKKGFTKEQLDQMILLLDKYKASS